MLAECLVKCQMIESDIERNGQQFLNTSHSLHDEELSKYLKPELRKFEDSNVKRFKVMREENENERVWIGMEVREWIFAKVSAVMTSAKNF
jgi:hypothetical protein